MDINEKNTEKENKENSETTERDNSQAEQNEAFSEQIDDTEKIQYDDINEELPLNETADGLLKEPVVSFEYDVKNDEEERAFLTFQKKYVYRHNWIVTAAFGAAALLFLISIFKYPDGYLNYVLCFLSLSVIFITWYNTRRIRKYLIKALKNLEDDKYIFTLYDDSFKIETIMTEEEKAAEDFEPIPPRIVNFSDISLNVIENDEMFIIILKKETIYVLAKRVMNDEQIKILRSEFSNLLGEDFESMQKE